MPVETYRDVIKSDPAALFYNARREQLIAHAHSQERLKGHEVKHDSTDGMMLLNLFPVCVMYLKCKCFQGITITL